MGKSSPLHGYQLDAIALGAERRIVELLVNKRGRADELTMDRAIALLELLQTALCHDDVTLIDNVVMVADRLCHLRQGEDVILLATAHWIVTSFHWNDQMIKVEPPLSRP